MAKYVVIVELAYRDGPYTHVYGPYVSQDRAIEISHRANDCGDEAVQNVTVAELLPCSALTYACDDAAKESAQL